MITWFWTRPKQAVNSDGDRSDGSLRVAMNLKILVRSSKLFPRCLKLHALTLSKSYLEAPAESFHSGMCLVTMGHIVPRQRTLSELVSCWKKNGCGSVIPWTPSSKYS